MKKILAGALFAAGAVAMSAPAFALDASWEAKDKAGTHQYYVWCTGGADSEKTVDAANMDEGQSKLAAQVGNSCWPIWQGLVN